MAVAALQVGGDMVRRLAGKQRAVVTDDAEARHRHRNLGVVHRLGWIPTDHGMTGGAIRTGCRVVGSLALGDRAVVAGDAGPERFPVLEMHIRAERDGVVACGTVVRARNMRRRLRRRVVLRPGDMAGAAVARRALEHRVQVTELAGQVAMHAIELEPRREVIEGYGDRRCLGSRGPRSRQECQHRQRAQCEPVYRVITSLHLSAPYCIRAPFQE